MLTSTQPDFIGFEIHIVLTEPLDITKLYALGNYCRITYLLQQRTIAIRDTKTVSLNEKYEILSTDALKNTVIWIVMPSSLAEIQRFFGGTYYLHHSG
jgi:hypothetical protein